VTKLFGDGKAGSLGGHLFGWPWQRTVNVVYYHYVGTADPHYCAFYRGCTAEKLSHDLQVLGLVFDFVPLSEVLAADGSSDRQRPTLAITFDDGFDLRREGGMDVLDKFGVKATTFVVTAAVGNQMLMWRYVLALIQAKVPSSIWRRHYSELATAYGFQPLLQSQTLLEATRSWNMKNKDEWASKLWEKCGLPPVEQYLSERRPYFDWKGLQEWVAAGHSVGFHTHTHPFCSRLDPADVEQEIIQPALRLKNRLGIEELCFAYPFGDRFQPDLEHQLFETGLFKALFGTAGLSRRGGSKAKLERLSLEGFRVGKQLLSERLWALRRGLLSLGKGLRAD
jgi:peptidoglycan/xylan/chitin deacetylase (PgdA/CDA1 family)